MMIHKFGNNRQIENLNIITNHISITDSSIENNQNESEVQLEHIVNLGVGPIISVKLESNTHTHTKSISYH